MLGSTEIDIDKNTEFNTLCLFASLLVISEFENSTVRFPCSAFDLEAFLTVLL
jgi:hypothetical protein